MKIITAFLFLLLYYQPTYCQNKTLDSLKRLLKTNIIDTQQINTINAIGDIYRRQKNDTALGYYTDALKKSIQIHYLSGELKARNRYADFIFRFKNDNVTALEMFLQNVKLEEENKDTAYLIWDTRNIAFIYDRIDDISKQLGYTFKMRDALIAKHVTDKKYLIWLQTNVNRRLGDVYEKLNQADSAKKYLYLTYQYGIDYNDAQWVSLGGTALGDLYKNRGMNDSAFFYYKKCIPYSIKANRPDLYQQSLNGMGELCLQAGNIDSAFSNAWQSYTMPDAGVDIESPELLSKIFAIKNKPDSAYKYLKISIELKDSTLSLKKLSQIQNISLSASLEKQQLEETQKEAISQYKNSIKIYSLVAGLAIFFLAILLLYRNNRRRHQANQQLAKAYADLKSTQSQLVQSEKMASLGELTAGIAHEIQNPLNFVNNFSEVNKELLIEMKEEIDKGNMDEVKLIANDVIENEEKINHHGRRADSIVKGMLQHSRSSGGQKEPTDINALADKYLRLAYHGLRAKDNSFNATMKTDYDAGIDNVNVIPQDIGRVLLNLYTNAFYAVAEKNSLQNSVLLQPKYEPTITVTTKKINNKIEIKVADNGNGIPKKVIDKIFQPFFTTKPTGQGTGLGLSLSYDIIKAHNGEIKVETKEGDGTTFIIQLPIV